MSDLVDRDMSLKDEAETTELHTWIEDVRDIKGKIQDVRHKAGGLHPEDGFARHAPNLKTILRRVRGRGEAMPDLSKVSEDVEQHLERASEAMKEAKARLNVVIRALDDAQETIEDYGQDQYHG